MSILRIAGVALVTAALSAVIKNLRPEYGIYIPLASSVIIFVYAVSELCGIFDLLSNRLSAYGLQSTYTAVLFKSLGIAYTAQLASDVCRDSGESAIASKVELCGKIAIFALCIPVITDVFDMIDEVLSMI